MQKLLDLLAESYPFPPSRRGGVGLSVLLDSTCGNELRATKGYPDKQADRQEKQGDTAYGTSNESRHMITSPVSLPSVGDQSDFKGDPTFSPLRASAHGKLEAEIEAIPAYSSNDGSDNSSLGLSRQTTHARFDRQIGGADVFKAQVRVRRFACRSNVPAVVNWTHTYIKFA